MRQFILFICAAFFLASCGNRIQVLKRHYTKGFYVAKSNNNKTASPPAGIKASFIEPVTARAYEENNSGGLKAQLITKERLNSKKTIYTRAPLRRPVMVKEEKQLNIKSNNRLSYKKEPFELKRDNADDEALEVIELILLIILAFIIPPLAVALRHLQIDIWFVVTLLLWLLAILAIYYPVASLFYVLAVVFAILYILDIVGTNK